MYENSLVKHEAGGSLAIPAGQEKPLLDLGSFANWLDPTRFGQMQQIAKVFASSALVPDGFRGKEADCLIAVQMAFRLDVDPFMLIQRMYVVHGKPGMEAQLAIALVNARGPFTGPIQWRFHGERKTDAWACTAYATHRQTGQLCEATVDWAMVKAEGWLGKNGSKWQSMPNQMFCYRTASFLARLYCPEVLMGLPTAEEVEDIAQRQVVDVSAADPIIAPETAAIMDLETLKNRIAALGRTPAEARAIGEREFGVKRLEELSADQGEKVFSLLATTPAVAPRKPGRPAKAAAPPEPTPPAAESSEIGLVAPQAAAASRIEDDWYERAKPIDPPADPPPVYEGKLRLTCRDVPPHDSRLTLTEAGFIPTDPTGLIWVGPRKKETRELMKLAMEQSWASNVEKLS